MEHDRPNIQSTNLTEEEKKQTLQPKIQVKMIKLKHTESRRSRDQTTKANSKEHNKEQATELNQMRKPR
jgi:hypothetical protein